MIKHNTCTTKWYEPELLPDRGDRKGQGGIGSYVVGLTVHAARSLIKFDWAAKHKAGDQDIGGAEYCGRLGMRGSCYSFSAIDSIHWQTIRMNPFN